MTTSINLPCEEIPQYLVDSGLLGPSWQPPDNALFQLVEATAILATHTKYKACGWDVHDGVRSNWSCKTLDKDGLNDFPTFDLDELFKLPNDLDPGDSNLTPGEITEEFIPQLTESPYWEQCESRKRPEPRRALVR